MWKEDGQEVELCRKLNWCSDTRRRTGQGICQSVAPNESRPLCRLILMLRITSGWLALHKTHGSKVVV
jgi:hypothetical protein